jgi:hypothetical protein
MLSGQEISALLEVLKEEDKPLESASASFARAFARADHFRVACAMCTMLADGLLGAPAQRLTALFLLHDLYRSEPLASQPFLPFLVDELGRVRDGAAAQIEHNLLCLLLADPPNKDMPKRSVLEIRAMLSAGEPLPLPNLRAMQLAFSERDQQMPPLRRRGVHATLLVPAAENDERGASVDALAEITSRVVTLGERLPERELNCRSFEPAFVRPPPPLLGLSDDELLWLSPCAEGSSLLWDSTMCTQSEKNAEVRELMAKAFKVRAGRAQAPPHTAEAPPPGGHTGRRHRRAPESSARRRLPETADGWGWE